MLSQMNLRFPKSLIAALKNRAADDPALADYLALTAPFVERLLRARQHGDRTRSYQGRHVSLHVPESGDIGLVLPNLRLRLAPDTLTTLEAELLAQLEHLSAAAALAELAALYGDL
ncbi:hypothetical protein [Serratia ureilytica]|uniref:hypothetical protein n=1 Tax=Serratia ureilytica TaxID=300181 RepID=UPI0018D5E0EE|nr:hypothetical protein [Serratia ureilytica]MBH3175957.1 hypothetical protein [Serratia ureilytica]